MRSTTAGAFAVYVAVSTFNYFFVKDGVGYASPVFFMGIRYLVAGLVLLAISRRIVVSRDAAVLGIITAASSGLWAMGLVYLSPESSAILTYTMPFLSIPMAYAMLDERVTARELLGMSIGFAGVAIYAAPTLRGLELVGAAATLANAALWGAYSVYYRKLKDEEPVSVNASQFLYGSAALLALAPIGFRFSPSSGFALDLFWAAIPGGAIQFLIWNLVLREERVGSAAVLSFAVPPLSVAVESIERMAPPAASTILGVAVMFAGVVLSRWGGNADIERRSMGRRGAT